MKVVLVPGVLALLPEYAGQADPVAELRAACLRAVAGLRDPVVLASTQGARVGESLLREGGVVSRLSSLAPQPPGGAASLAPRTSPSVEVRGAPATSLETTDRDVLVVANGSARRTEKAPGHLDDRAAAFDADLATRLQAADLGGIDVDLARELWAEVEPLAELHESVRLDPDSVEVSFADDPFGVQYWVIGWTGEWR